MNKDDNELLQAMEHSIDGSSTRLVSFNSQKLRVDVSLASPDIAPFKHWNL